MVRVINVLTREERYYTCSPKEAAVASYEQVERHNNNTWDYDFSQAKTNADGTKAVCGNWFAKQE